MEKPNFDSMDDGALDSLHQQLNKELGYATEDQKAIKAIAIAQVVNEKNRRLQKVFGEDGLKADIQGNINGAIHNEGIGENHEPARDVSAEILKDEGDKKDTDSKKQAGTAKHKK